MKPLNSKQWIDKARELHRQGAISRATLEQVVANESKRIAKQTKPWSVCILPGFNTVSR